MATYGYLVHHGILGQKWGVRRFQNPDGSLTEAGRQRYLKNYSKYNKGYETDYKRHKKDMSKLYDNMYKKAGLDPEKSWKEAAKQNDDIDSGKLKYEDSLWKKINDIDEQHAKKDEEGLQLIRDSYGPLQAKLFENTFKNIESIKLKDLEKQLSPEVAYDVADIIDHYGKEFTIDFNDNGDLEFIKKSVKQKRDLDKIENQMKELNKKSIESGSKLIKDADMIGTGESLYKDTKRSKNAAIVGLKALDGQDADLSKENIDWFLFEDQTTGMATVADLVNQGYNKNQIMDMIESAYHEDYDTIYNDEAKPGLWDLNEGYWHLTEKFIDDCIKYKQKQEDKNN